MREIELLAVKCRLSKGDLLALSREAAMCGSVAGPEELTADQQQLLIAFLRVLAAPMDVDEYFLASVA